MGSIRAFGVTPESYSEDRTNDNTRLYRDAVVALAKTLEEEYAGQKKIAVLDTYAVFEAQRDKVFHDGLHFNEYGEKLLWTAVSNLLNENGMGVTVDPLRGSAGNSGGRGPVGPYVPWHDDPILDTLPQD